LHPPLAGLGPAEEGRRYVTPNRMFTGLQAAQGEYPSDGESTVKVKIAQTALLRVEFSVDTHAYLPGEN